ncbi:putative multidrug resistance protein EmrY [compost metagenome]
MTAFTAEVGAWAIVHTGFVQGFGLGLVFVPLSTLSFATLAPRYRNEATALYSLMRNIGSGIGISLVIAYLAQRTQINHALLADQLTPFSQALGQAVEAGVYDLDSAAGLARLDREVTRQAVTLAYLQDFRLMMFVTLATLPLLVLLRPPQRAR